MKKLGSASAVAEGGITSAIAMDLYSKAELQVSIYVRLSPSFELLNSEH